MQAKKEGGSMITHQILGERYEMLERVGSGGMADVYRAHDKLLDRTVAVKILRTQFTDDEEFVSRFRREAQAAARLTHSNIVNIYDVGKDRDIYYIVMEYVDGETLKDRITREKQLPLDTAVTIALKIAEALEHAHQNGLVHCDIKPHNILTTPSGRVKVTDFGIARAVTSATMTHTVNIIGSVHYFSPEQAEGLAICDKSDIYSLGVVMYEMLTGTVPFSGETPISVAIKHIREDVPPLKVQRPDLPPLLEAIVLKAMAKKPDMRFAGISEMIADLRLAKSYLSNNNQHRAPEEYPTQVLSQEDLNTALSSDSSSRRRQTSQQRTGFLALLSWEGISRNRIWAVLTALFVLSGIGAFLLFSGALSTEDVTVPNVIGKNVEIAKKNLSDKKLKASVSEEFHDKIPVGQVVAQDPAPDSVVKANRTVNLTISRGGEPTFVPNLKGLSRRDAELQLKNSGLLIGRVDEQNLPDGVPDTVVGQNRQPNEQVPKGTAIDLVINKGPAKRKMTLPDFRGLPISSVTAQLEALKLKQGRITDTTSDRYVAGSVGGQNPAPGIEVAEDSEIDLMVVKGAELPTKKASVQVTVPAGAARQNIQIVVTDGSGRKTAYEASHKPGDKIDKVVEGSGTVRVQIYSNGGLLQEQTI